MNRIPKSLKFFAYIILVTLNGCGDKPEHARAKQLINEFNCPTANGVWSNFMKSDKEKAQTFLKNYEKGLHLFNKPIDEIIDGQLQQFQEACDSSNKNKFFPSGS